jgi:low affinity Fe/Cu permease
MEMASTGSAAGSGGFHSFAGRASQVVGSKWAFTLALSLIVAWAICGPYFHYSDTWQLVVNTATTVITFLIVFLIQNTQNRDARAIHLKLDEIIHAIGKARNEMIQIETLSDTDLDMITKNFDRIRAECDRRGKKGMG